MKSTSNIIRRLAPCLALPLAFAGLATPDVSAAIVVVAPTNVTPGSLTITQDISFTIQTTGLMQTLVLDEWVATDGSYNSSNATPGFQYDINGGPVQTAATSAARDNHNTPLGAITPNDGLMVWTGVPVTAGDIVTFKVGSYTLSVTSGFNPLASQTFTGNAFLTDQVGARLTANTSVVPEPSAMLLSVAAAGMLLGRRRR